MKETNIIQTIRLGCADIAVLMRNNVGALTDKTGRLVRYGLCVGSSDLIGWRKSDGRFVAIEVKMPGKKPKPEQVTFIDNVAKSGGLSGVATNADEARKIILKNI